MFGDSPAAPISGSTAPFKGHDYQELYDYFIPSLAAYYEKNMLMTLQFFKEQCEDSLYDKTKHGLILKDGIDFANNRDQLYWIAHDGIHSHYRNLKREALFTYFNNLDDTNYQQVRNELNLFLEALIRQSDEEHAKLFVYLRGIKDRFVFLHLLKTSLHECWS